MNCVGTYNIFIFVVFIFWIPQAVFCLIQLQEFKSFLCAHVCHFNKQKKPRLVKKNGKNHACTLTRFPMNTDASADVWTRAGRPRQIPLICATKTDNKRISAGRVCRRQIPTTDEQITPSTRRPTRPPMPSADESVYV